MDSFNYYMPARLIFGAGKLGELATSPYFPWKKALVVIGAGGAMRRSGILSRVQNLLASRGVDAIVYDRIKPNPEVDQVEEGARIALSLLQYGRRLACRHPGGLSEKRRDLPAAQSLYRGHGAP